VRAIGWHSLIISLSVLTLEYPVPSINAFGGREKGGGNTVNATQQPLRANLVYIYTLYRYNNYKKLINQIELNPATKLYINQPQTYVTSLRAEEFQISE
jgi:hypothetical protein